ncbi:MAG: hypothetical protein F4Y14_08615 [Acidobacteria bacterium]|nr:hypothetical protein [Acidobacteriota bacterium]
MTFTFTTTTGIPWRRCGDAADDASAQSYQQPRLSTPDRAGAGPDCCESNRRGESALATTATRAAGLCDHSSWIVLFCLFLLSSSLTLRAQNVRDSCALPLDSPLRSIHVAGNWDTTRETVDAWEFGADGSDPLVPSDYFDYLDKLHVNWVGLSVALHYDDSMDSTIERVYSNVDVPTFTDRALRQLIREFRGQGLDVYLTLAFEALEAETAARPVRRWLLGVPGTGHEVPPDDPARYGLILPEFWPWRPDHPDHQRFVSQFWDTYTEQAVHFATIAEEEGVRLYSLGTETDRLFRTRYGGHYWTNDFSRELRAMVEQVRTVYGGLLTYDMHYTAVTEDWFSPGSAELWEDLDLDVVGVSAWFPLTDTVPTEVLSLADLRNAFDLLFQEHVVPLASRNTGRPVVFTEFGAVDTMEAPFNPADWSMTGQAAVYTDSNGNGLDDGQETQANIYRALFDIIDENVGVVRGVFSWNIGIASDSLWQDFESQARSYNIRSKLSQETVRSVYECYARR